MKSRLPQLRYCALQGFIWGIFGVLVGYSHVYLLSLGLSNTQVSLTLAVASALSVGLTPLLTALAARWKGLTVSRVLCALAAGIALAGLLLLCLPGGPVQGVLLYGLAFIFLHLVPGFANSLGMGGIRRGLHMNFGIARGIGSICYSVVSLTAGRLNEQLGVWIIPALAGLLALGVFGFTAAFARCAGGCLEQPEPGKKEQGLFRANPGFLPFLAACVCLMTSHNLLTNFMYEIVVSKGGGTAQQGSILSLSAALELPTMFLFVHMARRWRCDNWMKLSAVFFTLRALGMLLAPNVGWALAVQFTQPLGFALYTVAGTYYVSSVVSGRYELRAQAFLHMTSTLGSIVSLLLGGVILDSLGAGALLSLAVAFGALGFVIYLPALSRVERVVGA